MTPGAGETQPERTALSWQRTSLGVFAVAAIIAHRGLVFGRAELFVVAGGCALLGVALAGGVAADRDRMVRAAAEQGRPVGSARLAAGATGVVVLVAVAAAVTVLVGRLGPA